MRTSKRNKIKKIANGYAQNKNKQTNFYFKLSKDLLNLRHLI